MHGVIHVIHRKSEKKGGKDTPKIKHMFCEVAIKLITFSDFSKKVLTFK